MNTAKVMKETEEQITLHGLGFLQIKLHGNQRMHVWHPGLPRRKCFMDSAIHDHRFGFVSRVIVGSITDNRWRAARVRPFCKTINTSLDTHIGYLHEGERTRFGNRPWIPDLLLTLEYSHGYAADAGDEYTVEPYVYHSSEPRDMTATIMKKTCEYSAGAHSLCAIGTTPDVDFDRKQWPEERMWEVVREVLGS